MENFYIISSAQAAIIGKFMYGENKQFDPFVGEQIDGNFIISETMCSLLKDTEQFKRIDFSSLTLIPQNELQTKIVSLEIKRIQ